MEQKAFFYIWQLTALEFAENVWIEGTVIRGSRQQRKEHSTRLGHFIEVLFSYFRQPAVAVELGIRTGKEAVAIQSDKRGRFSCFVEHFDPDMLQILYRDKPLLPPEGYPHYFEQKSTSLEVVSDLDDTVLHSHTASALKRIYNILFILPRKRKAVAYTYQLMEWFKQQQIRVTYLSKSESNLFVLISDFINHQQMPKGALLLSPHLRYNQLLKPHKGKDYKYKHLQTILNRQPSSNLILIGDDTQGDMEVYTAIIRDYPGRIKKVFIRQSSRGRNTRQMTLWQGLQDTKVPAIYFNDSDEVLKAIDKLTPLIQSSHL